ncbi:DoxX family protein [Nocardioides sp. KR10-350]|uniref:DoxX family protein n=1 Tax=Nocardioides cheoyonin TaxID=3156615 RepID=UPI0032B4EECD
MTLSRLIARPLMSSIFVVGPINALKNAEAHAKKAEPITGPLVQAAQKAGVPVQHDPKTMVRINAGVQLLGAVGLITGKFPRLSSALLAGSLVPTTLAGHRFWEESDPAAKKMQQIQFAKNLSLIGGLIIAAGDTEGKPGLAWRARRAAKDARREARHLAVSARQEAKLAKAKVA